MLLLRGICRAECSERNSVKKITLFEHSELGIFRSVASGMKVVGSYRPRSRPRSVFLFLFFPRKKEKGVVD